MAIFVDSAKESEVRQALQLGWVAGVTTNPLLLARAGACPEATLKRLAALGVGRLFYQLVSHDPAAMLAEAEAAHSIVGQALVLKAAPAPLGFCFAAEHSSRFDFCLTAVYSPAQALVAREVGARYVAVYVNRAARLVGDGPRLVKQIAGALANSRTEIVAASLKSPEEAVAAVEAGAQHIAASYEVLQAMMFHPLSAEAMAEFETQGLGLTEVLSKEM